MNNENKRFLSNLFKEDGMQLLHLVSGCGFVKLSHYITLIAVAKNAVLTKDVAGNCD